MNAYDGPVLRFVVAAAVFAGCGFSINVGGNNPAIDGSTDDGPLPIDSEIDGPPGLQCPPAFKVYGTSRYMFIVQPGGFMSQHQTCLAAAPGKSHLAVIDNAQEAVDLLAAVEANLNSFPGINGDARFRIGAVQASEEASPTTGWIDFQDRPVDPTLWFSPEEPNDGPDGNENNHQEQLAALRRGTVGLVDLGGDLVRSICECDGIPMGPLADSYLVGL